MSMPKPDFYTLIHKAIRFSLSDFLVRLGTTDVASDAEWNATLKGWQAIRDLLEAHSEHEDTHVHPLIRTVAADVADRLDADHSELDRMVGDLDRQMAGIAGQPDAAARRAQCAEAYGQVARFIARYFDHLDREESEAMPALLAGIDHGDLHAARLRLVGSIPPEDRLSQLVLIARSLSGPERIALMAATKAGAPPAFFAEACRIMAEVLGPDRFDPIASALDLNAA